MHTYNLFIYLFIFFTYYVYKNSDRFFHVQPEQENETMT